MKKYLFIITIFIGLLSVSCEDFLDVNTDPNNPVEVSPDLLLPVAQWYTADWLQQNRGVSHLGNMFMYNWSETYGFSWYDEEFKYLVTSTFYDKLFDESYSRALKQYSDLDGLDDEFIYYKAISKIMKVYHFQILVDLYGDIPYSEALMRGANATPVYDDAATIYADLLVQLTAAIDMINTGATAEVVTPPTYDDVMFGGDMVMWKQFANTLKLRILVRGQNTLSYAAELAAITAEGSGYISSDVIIQPGYAQEVNKQNPFWNELGWSVDGTVKLSNDATCATQWILDQLTANNDPRIDFIYEMPADGHMGVDQGSNPGDTHAADFVSNIGAGILKEAGMGANIFSLAESNFNQAEAALNMASGGDPEALYNAGVAASFAYLGAGDPATYLSQINNNVSYANSTNKLEAIITQKWTAVNGITAEQSWFDYTRTGYPANLPVSLMASTDDRPVRLFYPSSEIVANTANLPKQPNAFSAKIFWAN